MTIEEEINMYFTLLDAEALIADMGFYAFIEHLFKDKFDRVLSHEESEALAVLTKGWKQP